MRPVRGSFWVLVLYDVAEQLDLDRVREIVGAGTGGREPSFKHPAPDYVRFERPPVVEHPGTVSIATGERLQSRVKYFDYGVISVELKLPFEGDWESLIRLSSQWISAPDIEKCTAELLGKCLDRTAPALVQPYGTHLSEDYYVFELTEIADGNGAPITASQLVAEHASEITRIVRGESVPLGESERNEALQSSLSYYATDLIVVGWVAALIYDTPEGAAPAIQLLEYANTQLLEFRHYDDLLTRVLEDVYKMLEHRAGFLRHWKMARQAQRLNAMRLEVTELTERSDNSIKFLSDMFYARAYRVAAARIGVNDYRNLVDRKLRIADDLYKSMVDEFHQARSFFLEVMVVAILVIELIALFRSGK